LAQASERLTSASRAWALIVFEALIVAPTLLVLAFAIARHQGILSGEEWAKLVSIVLIVALVELVPVPMWRGTHISMGFPLLMVVAFLYAPSVAASAAFLAASDPREIRREVGFLHALFNRSQVALAVGAASIIFHSLVESVESSNPFALLGTAAVAAVADYVVNATLVTLGASFLYRMHPLRVVRQLRVGRLTEFVISYLGLAIFGVILARIFSIEAIGFWSVPVFVIPLLLARQMFFRSKALEEAHKELQDREHVLRALSNRMAEERQDERMQIAAFLHDDLAQLLFRLSIQVDVARRHISSGKVDEVEKLLSEIKDTKNRTSDRIRALIRDLHRSPLGRAGLAEALRSFIVDAGSNSDVHFHVEDIDEVELPAPIALLMYHIGREAIMNSLKHANAKNMWITVKQHGDEVEMVLRDDGKGFDVDAPGPEGHYGVTMMRERATVGGGTFEMSSAPGEGSTIKVRFPTLWLQPDAPTTADAQPPDQPPATSRDGAAPGTVPAPSGSTQSVPA
jgi:signal transduction histidine kinase